MDKPLPRMTGRQLRRAKRLVRRLCANYEDGNCLLLEDGDTCACPQMISCSVLCRYFRSAVLPADPALYAEVMEKNALRRCIRCGSPFVPTGSRAVYCKGCSCIQEKKRKAAWARKHREERRRLSPGNP